VTCRRALAIAFVLTLGLGAASCGGGEDGDDGASAGGSGEVTVFAAASLTEVLQALDPAATYSFAGSDELAAQIREGAPADVYAAASPKYPQELFAEGLVEKPVIFATNQLVVVVPTDNPAGIQSVEDVANEGVKLVIADEGVPVGDYTRTALENLGLTAALDNVVSEEQDVKGVVTKVATGEADAGFVYATDVKPVEGDVEAIEIPTDAQPPVEYQAAIVSDTERRDEAQAFLDLLLGAEGRSELEAAGFGLP
jgi:molybdate transport system substrate-binding protein